MDFITLDFETANSNPASPCELGITFVENNQIIETKSWLIKPKGNYFNYYNTKIHGIGPENVIDAPEFYDLWSEVKPFVEDRFILAHNASFDMNVLRKTLELYDLSIPQAFYGCTVQLARKIWPDRPKYDLKSLCDWNNIQFKHHRAGADSEATAEFILKGFEQKEIFRIEDLKSHLGYQVKSLRQLQRAKKVPKKYQPSGTIFSANTGMKPLKETDVFRNKNIVITGTIPTMSRRAAEWLLVELGATIQNEVNETTEILIQGEAASDSQYMTRKLQRYYDLLEKGYAISCLNSAQFLHLIYP